MDITRRLALSKLMLPWSLRCSGHAHCYKNLVGTTSRLRQRLDSPGREERERRYRREAIEHWEGEAGATLDALGAEARFLGAESYCLFVLVFFWVGLLLGFEALLLFVFDAFFCVGFAPPLTRFCTAFFATEEFCFLLFDVFVRLFFVLVSLIK